MAKEMDVPGPVPTLTRYSGVFDLGGLLRLIRGKMLDSGYLVGEPTYVQRQVGAGDKMEIEIKGDKDVTHYVKFKLTVLIRSKDTVDVEVTKNNEKVKMKQGNMQVFISGQVVLDYGNRFAKNKFLEALQDFYHNYVIKYTLENKYWDNLHAEIFQLQRAVREQLHFEATI
jgi:hypothetical protein